MKKLNLSLVSAAILSLSLFSISPSIVFAAEELSPEQATKLQPFKEITSRGTYYSHSDAANVVSKLADKEGADYYYIKSIVMHSRNESLRIAYVDLYKADAGEITKDETLRQFKGVYEYPKTKALLLEPYDIIRIRGYYPTPSSLNEAVGKAAATKGAYAFYIDRQVSTGTNTSITAYLFKQDAQVRLVQPENAIPYDSESGQKALAMGGEVAAQVEKPGYYSSTAFNEQFYSEKFNAKEEIIDKNTSVPATEKTIGTTKTVTPQAQSIKPQAPNSRYTVTLADGTKIQELNNATALKMVPFDTIKFRGYYASNADVTYQAAKRAAAQGAKYFHITRIATESSGPNRTIYVDLFK